MSFNPDAAVFEPGTWNADAPVFEPGTFAPTSPWFADYAACECCQGYCYDCKGEDCANWAKQTGAQLQCLCSVPQEADGGVVEECEMDMASPNATAGPDAGDMTPAPRAMTTTVGESSSRTLEEASTCSESPKLRKYSVGTLKAFSGTGLGECPEGVDEALKQSSSSALNPQSVENEAGIRKYNLDFLRMFQDKRPCKKMPAMHSIPACLQPDDPVTLNWRDRHERQAHQSTKKKGKTAKSVSLNLPQDSGSFLGSGDRFAALGGGSGGRGEKAGPPIPVSENSWQAKNRREDQDIDSLIKRKMQALLNKLTLEKFETLYDQLLDVGISKPSHVEDLMKMVFEKAVAQHHFIAMYTELCCRLSEWIADNEEFASNKEVSFKRILLNQCQESFEKNLTPAEGLKELSGDELLEAEVKYKTGVLGNMKFVGQLLIRRELSSKVIFQCLDELLKISNEATLETLCVFLTTIGPTFDTPKWERHEKFKRTFEKVEELSKSTEFPHRIRCLLKDVVDLRKKQWRGCAKTEGPMKLSEVHAQWAADNKADFPGGDRRSGASTSKGGRGSDKPDGNWRSNSNLTVSRGNSARGSSRSFGSSFGSDDRGSGRGSTRKTEPRWVPGMTMTEARIGDKLDKSVAGSRWKTAGKENKDVAPNAASPPAARPVPAAAGSRWANLRMKQSPKMSPKPSPMLKSKTAPKPTSGGKKVPPPQVTVTPPVQEEEPDEEPEESPEVIVAKEIQSIMREMQTSKDADASFERVKAMEIPDECQAKAFLNILSAAVQFPERDESMSASFEVISRIFEGDEPVMSADIIGEAMQSFMDETYPDLKLDVPRLPAVMKSLAKKTGLVSAFEPYVDQFV